jgi:adenosylcobinamide kinase/adenosylcobinamide-phosphate guanylyltransferase
MCFIFISGAARSGKSSWAEKQAIALAASSGSRLVYIATGQVTDDEMRRRVALHQAARAGKGFETLERYWDLVGLAPEVPLGATALLECLGTLLANEVFGIRETSKPTAPHLAAGKIFEGIALLRKRTAHLLVVSNDVFSDGATYDEPTENYRYALGSLHAELAREADMAVECVAGLALPRKTPSTLGTSCPPQHFHSQCQQVKEGSV